MINITLNLMSKNAYFTIDDSPSVYMKEKVDILTKKKIPAIFFCQGNYMEKYPEQVIYAIKKGFVIGNHSYSHPRFCDIDLNECFNQILKTDKIIDDLYKKANVKRGIKYFRYPKGIKGDITYLSLKILFKKFDSKFKSLEKFLTNLDYMPLKIKNVKLRYPELLRLNDTDTYWTIDIREWKMIKNDNHKISDVLNFIDNNLSSSNSNEILLVHDHEQTHRYFEQIIEKIMSKNFNFLDVPK